MIISKLVSISIVSHNHGQMVVDLLNDLKKMQFQNIELIVTNNVPDKVVKNFISENKDIHLIENNKPLGFGTNHNYAFSISKGDYFLVLNPDVRIKYFDFEQMIQYLDDNDNVFCSVPKVLNMDGELEDNIRNFPSISDFLGRFLGAKVNHVHSNFTSIKKIEWAAGIFLLFPKKKYELLKGFDQKYFMYMEDVDICYRIMQLKGNVMYFPELEIFHDARRKNRKNIKHFYWHVTGILRFFLSR